MTQRPPNAETLKSRLATVVDLYSLDIAALLPPGSTDQSLYHFCNWTQTNGSDVIYKGVTYTALPLEASGFERSTKGQLERPSITFANIGLAITGLANTYEDLVGATVGRMRTLTTYLDGQPGADPDAYWGPDEWIVEQKSGENRLSVTFQLAVAFDLEGRSLPARRMLREQCPWDYKSDIGCHYAGANGYFDINDVPTGPAGDICGKRLESCKLRFGNTGRIPFGGFPGLVDQSG
jgi:lambda family phage minor tail protein L